MPNRVQRMRILREIVGWRAFNALLKGRPLMIWRCTTPHNIWIPAAPTSKYSFLWHSSKNGNRPALDMFENSFMKSKKIISYWGADSGMNEESKYFLKKEFIKSWKRRKK